MCFDNPRVFEQTNQKAKPRIMDALQHYGNYRVSSLTSVLGIPAPSVRRSLNELKAAGKVRKNLSGSWFRTASVGN